MDENTLRLVIPTEADAGRIDDYAAEFPRERERVTLDPDRIPGLDYYEKYANAIEWLDFCRSMEGKITWYMSERVSDGKIVGFMCLRHSLEYDDDDEEFASNIGYSVRPSERGRGYGKEQLRLCLGRAKALGLDKVRIICRDTNTASAGVILACGGVYIDTIHGEQSGMSVNRYDILLK